MSAFFNDIRFGIRQLAKSPGFTLIVVLTLALGIGASTTLFGALKALVLDPFPFPESDRIVYVWNRVGWPLSVPDFKDLREQNGSFAEMGVFTERRYNFGFESPESVYGIRCSAGVLPTLGIRPVLGRWLQESDGQPGAATVAVISHSLWSRGFDRDPAALGKTIQLDGQETTVVGVLPADFEFPSAWYDGHDPEVWVPVPLDNRWRGNHWLLGIGRLKPGVSLERADADLKAIGKRLTELYPDTNTGKAFVVRSLHWQMTRHMASGLRLLFGAVALLMLVACANASGMLLARGSQRQDEFAVRLALGAPRRRVIRLVLMESLGLGIAGACVGVLCSVWGITLLRNLLPARLVTAARRTAIEVDGWVLLFSVSLALVTALIAGMIPALMAARTSVRETLQEGGRSRTGSHLRHRFLKQLVATQIATAVILAHGALLLSASYLKVREANRSLNTEQVLTAEVTLRDRAYEDQQVRLQFWQQLCQQLDDLPGVQAVGITSKLPLEGGNNRSILVDDQAYETGVQRDSVEQSYVTEGYFAAMGIPFLSGRTIRPDDTTGTSVGMVINRAMAQEYWPEGNPIGGRVRPNSDEPDWAGQVVGVVESTRQWGAEADPIPEMYFPQAFRTSPSGKIVVRASGYGPALLPLIRKELASLDRNLPLANIRTMKQVLQEANSNRRFSTQLMNTMVGVTLALTVVGIYGTLSYLLLQRQGEIGIRMALGALPQNILRFSLSQAGLWLISGLGVGLAGANLFSLILRSRVYGVNPWNPTCLLLGLAIVSAASLLACLVPVLRTLRTDPMRVLRYE